MGHSWRPQTQEMGRGVTREPAQRTVSVQLPVPPPTSGQSEQGCEGERSLRETKGYGVASGQQSRVGNQHNERCKGQGRE